MPVNTNFQVPFIPQEGITSQILAAITMANEHHARQQQIALQQQAQPSEVALRTAQTGVAGATQKDIEQQIEQRKSQNEMLQRSMEYVFGAGGGGGKPSGEEGPHEQKPGLYSDIQETKKRLKLTPEENAQFDQALKSVQVGFLSNGKLDMAPVDKVIQEHMAAQNKKDTELHPTYRQEGNQWFQDMHTAEGKLAYSVPTPPPSEYLSHATEGVDYMRTVDANTGKVTITPIQTQHVTTPIMPGQPVPKPAMAGGGQPFELQGSGKKLSEAGQKMITGLTQATDLVTPAMNFLTGDKKPSNADWYKAVAKYKIGVDPGGEFANTFQAVGLLKAVATGPLLNGIRNPKIIKGIQDHLPEITDTPALVRSKLKDLVPFWKQAMDEVYKTEHVNPPAGVSNAASDYLKSIGVPH